ncbi:ankyrin repeat domain containing protein [Pandoravirus celtis]|uniref:Ankyrin repeat domain containing protein n=1 Tax=Pandoravirus celtis TaxID=2568002 RepID=A0A4D6EJV4_9VIRU|nr:ankyrin repeat domain containing protein [Pandoravirus celtis]
MVRRSALKDDPLDPWGCFRRTSTKPPTLPRAPARSTLLPICTRHFANLDPVWVLAERRQGGLSRSAPRRARMACRVGCDGRYRPGCMSVQDAVNKGNPALVEWAVRVAKPWHRFIAWPMVHTLAVRNDVPMMDLVARLGLYPLSSDDVAVAAGAGSLDVVRWAAGEAIEGVVGAHDGPRVAEWCSTKVARTAAKRGRIEIVQWLLNHPHATHFVGASAAQRALAKGHYEIVRLLGEAGRADFGRWDALFRPRPRATSTCCPLSLTMAVSTDHVLAAALEGRYAGIVGYLCDKYAPSYADMIEAIHTANQTYDTETTDLTVDWLVEHVSAAASLQPMLQRSTPRNKLFFCPRLLLPAAADVFFYFVRGRNAWCHVGLAKMSVSIGVFRVGVTKRSPKERSSKFHGVHRRVPTHASPRQRPHIGYNQYAAAKKSGPTKVGAHVIGQRRSHDGGERNRIGRQLAGDVDQHRSMGMRDAAMSRSKTTPPPAKGTTATK